MLELEVFNSSFLHDEIFGGKKSAIEIDSSIWREEIVNRNRLVNLAGRNCKNRENVVGVGLDRASRYEWIMDCIKYYCILISYGRL